MMVMLMMLTTKHLKRRVETGLLKQVGCDDGNTNDLDGAHRCIPLNAVMASSTSEWKPAMMAT